MSNNYLIRAKEWLNSEIFDGETIRQVQHLIEQGGEELEDSFYKDLDFGTGGMRGITGPGTNRINSYTIGLAVQALSNYLKDFFPDEQIKVAVAYDVRNGSRELGKLCADILSANGIKVLLFQDHRPTPELSYTVRAEKCNAGIVLTASHNPPEYNGFKVYWKDGAQVVPPHDKKIIEIFKTLNFKDIKKSSQPELIEISTDSHDQKYINTCIKNSRYQKNLNLSSLKVVFTPLHGTTYTTIPIALKQIRVGELLTVTEQMIPDGNFSTVKSPNPEEAEALKEATSLAEKMYADLLIGTDPDGDRMGIGVLDRDGKIILLNGNEANAIMTDYILRHRQNHPSDFIASTIVTSDIFHDLAEIYGIECYSVLTGFKWIGELIENKSPDQNFICGGEESYGFLTGAFIRDKDSCGSSILICEIAAWCKSSGKNLLDYLKEIQFSTNVYSEDLVSITKKGVSGQQEINQIIQNLREMPPKEIAGAKVICILDYQLQRKINDDISEKMDHLPVSNVLIFETEKGDKLAVRPSGTEPKIKFYISTKNKCNDLQLYNFTKVKLNKRIKEIKSFIEEL